MTGQVVVVGGANVDIKGRLFERTELHTSNPGAVWRASGGVGRNIAENLAILGCAVRLIAPVGNDEAGEYLMQHLQTVGVDVSAVVRLTGHRTGTYLAVMNSEGELDVAVSDMSIMDALTPERLTALPHAFTGADIVCIDANLSEPSLHALVDWVANVAPGAKIVADPVSVPKARRLLPSLNRIDLFTPSRDELAALTDLPVDSPRAVACAARSLLDRGVHTVVVTLGPDGVYFCSANEAGFAPAHAVDVVDVTGAGDAFTAGMIYAMRAEMSLAPAIEFAQSLSARIIASTASVLRRDDDDSTAHGIGAGR